MGEQEPRRATKGVRITKRVVDGVDLKRGRHVLWDSELKGFGLQVEPTGTKTYIVRYRPKGLGRSGPRRFVKLGRHGDVTPDEAREQAKIVLGKVAGGQDPADTRIAERLAYEQRKQAITVEQLGEVFLREHAKPLRKASTASNYEILLRRHINPALGGKIAHSLTRSDVAALHLSMQDAQASANRMLTLLSSMYSFGVKRELLPEVISSPTKGIEKYREEGSERYLSSDELLRLSQALIEAETVGIPWDIDVSNPKSKHTPKLWKGQRDLVDPYAVAAIRLLLFTGARLREILHLTWRNVDTDRELLFLSDSKTGKKSIVLNVAAFDVLLQLRRKVIHEKVRPEGFVIKGLVDDQPRADLKRPWRAIRRHADLEGVRLHDLRHTFASIGAGASLGLPVVGKLLGHSQPQTTAR